MNPNLRTRVDQSPSLEVPTIVPSPAQRHLPFPLTGVDNMNPNLRTRVDQSPSLEVPTIVPSPAQRHLPFPLTDIQQAYWTGRNGTFELGNVSTHLYMEIESAKLDLGRLNLAWQKMIQRHDMLRAIVLPDGQQRILEEVPPYEIAILDLRAKDPQEIEVELKAIRQRMSHQVLPSDRWPIFDFRASRLDERKVRLHLSLDMLIMDARSQALLFYEWSRFYQDPELRLPALELAFRDYVMAEVALRKSKLYQRDLEYWRSRLQSLAIGSDLPLARSPSSISKAEFTSRVDRLNPPEWDSLRRQASQRGLGFSALLLAAFSEVLRVWSKSREFTINVTLFNRMARDPRLKNVMGDYTSSLLLGVTNHDAVTFEARALKLQRQLREDLQHTSVSGVQVVRELTKMRHGESVVTMPVVFTSLVGAPSPSDDSVPTAWYGESAWLGDNIYTITQTPQVWLDHQAREQNGALVFTWDAVEALFPAGLLDDMFDAYRRLLHRLADEEESWQEGRYEMGSKLVAQAALQQRALINSTQAPVSEGLLHSFFAAQALQRPDRPAVIAPRRTLTYEELSRRANQVGHWLRQREAHPNSLVAVVMEKGWEQVVGVLGTLASGAAYLPVDAALPRERLSYLLEHGQVSLVLTQSWHDQKIEWPAHIRRLCVDRADQLGLDDSPLEPVHRPEDLAYVIYTSGSTGLPKGVMIDHRGAVNTILDVNRRFGVQPEDRVLALSSLNFDLSVYDIFGLLAAGGTIVIPEAFSERNPGHWVELVARHRVTIWNTVPTLMQMLVEYLAGCLERIPDSLRLVMMSGDWIPIDLPDRIKSMTADVKVVSLGGATEASIWSIFYPIERVEPWWRSIPYGRPMANQSFHVLNNALAPCPPWVAGQLYIGGIGLAKGYWRDEEKTQGSFINHSQTGQRLYRTGDLGRYLPDGNIEFLGREDYQVKIRGHRIELGEIESVLLQHPGVQAAVAHAAGEARGIKRLIAYVVPRRGTVSRSPQEGFPSQSEVAADAGEDRSASVVLDPLERLKFKLEQPGLREDSSGRPSVQLIGSRGRFVDELREFLGEKLPDYMVPSSIVLLESLPLSPNGKVDRKALPEPEVVNRERTVLRLDPATELERALADICREVLGVERVGIDENFFELGADSVMAIQIIAKANKAGLQLSPRDFFEHQTIVELATIAGNARHASGRQAPATDAGAADRSGNEGDAAPATEFGWSQAELDGMAIETRPFTSEHIEAMKAFNRRLAQGGSKGRFSESPVPEWLPRREGIPVYQEHIVALEGDVVRGAYLLKAQPFAVRDEVVMIAAPTSTLSEGIINPRFAVVGIELIRDATARHSLLFGLGMGSFDARIVRLVQAMKWRLVLCPFYFRVIHPHRFLRQITFLRRDRRRRFMLDALAYSGLGWLVLKVAQAYKGLGRGGLTGIGYDVVPEFSAWADTLWERARGAYAMIAVRDSTILNALYPVDDARFIRLQVARRGKPIGWAVLLDTQMVGHSHFGGMRVGSVVDCLAEPGDELTVVAMATRHLAHRGVDLIVTNQLHRDWCNAFARNGFLEGPSNFTFGTSPTLTARLEPFEATAGRIHMTRGDGHGPIHL